MSVLLQISDTHFGTEQGAVVEAMGALFARSSARHARSWTAWGRQCWPFQATTTSRSSICGRACAAPMGGTASRSAQISNRCTTLLEPVHHSPKLLVVCVNTTRPWRHKDGEVSALQIDRVARLRGHAAALQRWAEAGADLVMGGHIHLPYVMPAPGLARPLWVVQAGTAVSSLVRDGSPNSVNLLRWGTDAAPGCCRIEQWDYDADDRTFRVAKASEVRLDRA